ncbi:hypothetical protein TVAG_280740 [Trichomonas vaginalis G3]|uniref:Uncharacterized protein n=1 Tax=Trichomonas vaginalis (strain ATCC PRA-98 / G3) TaxID=412133 RepID=A2DRJ5_TRIV3|nr:hypothetical protein TVAGG3_0697140 [Trichomonas vaginalis G3]EAY16958.1 hypothetical protein TVAG_280740 [Trichomonas vaginalis G3]KAI5508996.1 hypothetical protein TVAGG3_0697140 [Trichomonas vaginalis G3]|eukprot:XP_001329181.1 hypothetical protein [Trichomonas vaginalis G3]
MSQEEQSMNLQSYGSGDSRIDETQFTPEELEIIKNEQPSFDLMQKISNYVPRQERQESSNIQDDQISSQNSLQLNSNEFSGIQVHNDSEYEQAIQNFEQPQDESGNFVSMFGVTEPGQVKINYTGQANLAIENTYPYLERPRIEGQEGQEEEEVSNIPLEEELLSSRTMALTVSALLDNIMKETKPDLSSESSKINLTEENSARQEEKAKRLAAQASAAERLSKPKPKKLPLEELPQPKTARKRSKKEQELAAERLSKGHAIAQIDMPEVTPIPFQLQTRKHNQQTKIKVVRAESESSARRNETTARTKTARSNDQTRFNQNNLYYDDQAYVEKAPKDFVDMLSGKTPRPSTSINQTYKKREVESRFTHKEISEMVDKIISGKKMKIDDPGTIADVVNELTNRRIAALNKSDYLESLKLQKLADEMKTQFRLRDREQFHQDYMNDLNSRLEDAKKSLKKAEEEWKDKEKALIQAQKENTEKIEQKMDDEMEDLEYKWQCPETTRRFSKKSPQLLNQQFIEKNLALIGDLVGAAKMQKVVQKTEKIEAEYKYNDMQSSFEKERKNLIDQQDQALEHLKNAQTLEFSTFTKQKEESIGIIKRRIATYERIINDDKDIDKFCARKFKRNADVVVPMTVTANGGDDIPTNGKVRATPINLNGIMSFREAPVASPLQLPTLKIKKTSRKARVKKLTNTKGDTSF